MYDEDFDDENDEQPQGHDLVKSLRKQIRERDAKITSLTEEVGKLTITTTKRSLEEALPPGVKKGIVRHAVNDGVTDADGLKKWLEENADDFGIDLTPPEETDEGEVDEDDAAAMRGVQRQTASGGQNPSRSQLKLKELDDATDIESWKAAVNRLNNPGSAE